MDNTPAESKRHLSLTRIRMALSQLLQEWEELQAANLEVLAERVAADDPGQASIEPGSLLVDFSGLCGLLGCKEKHRNTRARWVREKVIPPPVRTPAGPRWIVADVLAWLRERQCEDGDNSGSIETIDENSDDCETVDDDIETVSDNSDALKKTAA